MLSKLLMNRHVNVKTKLVASTSLAANQKTDKLEHGKEPLLRQKINNKPPLKCGLSTAALKKQQTQYAVRLKSENKKKNPPHSHKADKKDKNTVRSIDKVLQTNSKSVEKAVVKKLLLPKGGKKLSKMGQRPNGNDKQLVKKAAVPKDSCFPLKRKMAVLNISNMLQVKPNYNENKKELIRHKPTVLVKPQKKMSFAAKLVYELSLNSDDFVLLYDRSSQLNALCAEKETPTFKTQMKPRHLYNLLPHMAKIRAQRLTPKNLAEHAKLWPVNEQGNCQPWLRQTLQGIEPAENVPAKDSHTNDMPLADLSNGKEDKG